MKQEPKAVPLPETTPVKPGTVRKNSIGMELVWVPPGDFMMGSTEAEVRAALLDCRRHRSYSCGDQWGANETPRRKITFAEGFWIGRFEVTQGEWQSVMGDNPSYFRDCGARCPVESISWEDVRSFLTRLNAQDKQFEYQLPSEAEWEYAARAGTTTTFAFGNELDPAKANFQGTQDLDFSTTPWKTLPVVGKTVAVGSFAPNAWGLCDMHGNVWEWVRDIYNPGYAGLPTDGKPNLTAGDPAYRVVRGGAWDIEVALYARSAHRVRWKSGFRMNNTGFRLVASAR